MGVKNELKEWWKALLVSSVILILVLYVPATVLYIASEFTGYVHIKWLVPLSFAITLLAVKIILRESRINRVHDNEYSTAIVVQLNDKKGGDWYYDCLDNLYRDRTTDRVFNASTETI